MDKTLTRKMFRVGNKQHQGTGIASGLSYRPGYNAGGRVGFSHGGLHSPPPAGFDGSPDENLSTPQPRNTLKTKQDLISVPTFEDEIKRRQDLRNKYITDIDYNDPRRQINFDKQKRTFGETISDTALNFLKKRQEIIPAGTVGSPNQFLDLGIAMGDARKSTKDYNKELDKLRELQDIGSYQDSETARYNKETGLFGTTEAELEKINKRNETISDNYSTLANQFNIAGLSADTSLAVAEIQANALPAETKNYNNLVATFISQGMSPEDASSKAFGMAYKTINSQLDFASTLIGSLASGDLMSAEEKGDAVMKAFQIMTNMGGSSFLLDKTQMQNIADILSSNSNTKDENDAIETLTLE